MLPRLRLPVVAVTETVFPTELPPPFVVRRPLIVTSVCPVMEMLPPVPPVVFPEVLIAATVTLLACAWIVTLPPLAPPAVVPVVSIAPATEIAAWVAVKFKLTAFPTTRAVVIVEEKVSAPVPVCVRFTVLPAAPDKVTGFEKVAVVPWVVTVPMTRRLVVPDRDSVPGERVGPIVVVVDEVPSCRVFAE